MLSIRDVQPIMIFAGFLSLGAGFYAPEHPLLFALVVGGCALLGLLPQIVARFGSRQLVRTKLSQSRAMAVRISDARCEKVAVSALREGDEIFVDPYQTIPVDGVVLDGISMVDESAVTGESAPVIREPAEDRCYVTAGSRVLSSRLRVRCAGTQQSGFLWHVARELSPRLRRLSRAERALSERKILLVFLFFVSAALGWWFAGSNSTRSDRFELALLTMLGLVPWTLPSLLAMLHLRAFGNALAQNFIPRASEDLLIAGRIDTIVVDKTGTLTEGERRATDFIPLEDVTEEELARAAQLASIADETPEGRSIVVLAKRRFQFRTDELKNYEASFISFTPETRMSGLNLFDAEHDYPRVIMKGSCEAIAAYFARFGKKLPPSTASISRLISDGGGTPLVVVDGERCLGIIRLADPTKGATVHFGEQLRRDGVKPVLLTGDADETAKAVARLFGIESIISSASPAEKLATVRLLQKQGCVVGMVGDGANDAPALAQADLGIAFNSGAHRAREVAHVLDLESRASKVRDLIRIGRTLGSCEFASFGGIFAIIGVNATAMFVSAAQGHRETAVVIRALLAGIAAMLLFSVFVIFISELFTRREWRAPSWLGIGLSGVGFLVAIVLHAFATQNFFIPF